MISDESFPNEFESSSLSFKKNISSDFIEDNISGLLLSPSCCEVKSKTDSVVSNEECSTNNHEFKKYKNNNRRGTADYSNSDTWKTQSWQNLHLKTSKKRYQHVESKVKQYIIKIQEEDARLKAMKSVRHRSLPENLSHYNKTDLLNDLKNENYKKHDLFQNNSTENLIKLLEEKEKEIEQLKTFNENLKENLRDKSLQLNKLRSNADSVRIELLRMKEKERRMSQDCIGWDSHRYHILNNSMTASSNIRYSLPLLHLRNKEITESRNSIPTEIVTLNHQSNCSFLKFPSQIETNCEQINGNNTSLLNNATGSTESSIRRRSGNNSNQSSNNNYDYDEDSSIKVHTFETKSFKNGENYQTSESVNCDTDSDIEIQQTEDIDDVGSSEYEHQNLLETNKSNKNKKLKRKRSKIKHLNFVKTMVRRIVCCKRTESIRDDYFYDVHVTEF